ncbi:CD2 antigen cytoplasmic tail-binding protein 2 [Smittium culicis]|uniref:CD2 antigen cytoplasmic tail-binding protein 2 n=1 Tax=Smittium culicis TaxID=133412 RepID=A0A1R1YEK5_9FUNG|nr:CD2 antigen cytoplasmic tail-binding protein 2 [Smittium culicis]
MESDSSVSDEDYQYDIPHKKKISSALKGNNSGSSSEDNGFDSSESEDGDNRAVRKFHNLEDEKDTKASKKLESIKHNVFGNDDDDDMFNENFTSKDPERKASSSKNNSKSDKNIANSRFLDIRDIEGQEYGQNSGSDKIRSSDYSDEDDNSESEKNPKSEPKIEAFNMADNYKEGKFDDEGNFVWNKKDSEDIHDTWLTGISKKDIKIASKAKAIKDDEELKKLQSQAKEKLELFDGRTLVSDMDLKSFLIEVLDSNETILSALGKMQSAKKSILKADRKNKKVTKSKAHAQPNKNSDNNNSETDNVSQLHGIIKKINQLTEIGDRFMLQGFTDCYEWTREKLVEDIQVSKERTKRQLRTREQLYEKTSNDFKRPKTDHNQTTNPSIKDQISDLDGLLDDLHDSFQDTKSSPNSISNSQSHSNTEHKNSTEWEYKWANTPESDLWGPFPSEHMSSWKDSGFFNSETVARKVGEDEFKPILSIDFT